MMDVMRVGHTKSCLVGQGTVTLSFTSDLFANFKFHSALRLVFTSVRVRVVSMQCSKL